MAKVINPSDFIGKKFGKLTVVSHLGFIKEGSSHRFFSCLCECGDEKQTTASKLKSLIGVCCKRCAIKNNSTRNTKHGKSKSPEFTSWSSMIGRCYNKNGRKYPRYGGRGIVVCDRWKDSFENFLADMGEKPKDDKIYSVERINNNGNYEPSNCKWIPMADQAKNKSDTLFYEINGVTRHGRAWGREWGVTDGVLYNRLRRMEKSGEAIRLFL